MITLDNNSKDPLYIQIYNALRNEIISGQLPQGSKLVSTRNLAVSLNVSRNTIESAYLQLSSEGYISSRAGSRYIVDKLDNSIMLKFKEKLESNEDINKLTEEINVSKNYQYDFQYGNLSSVNIPLQQWKKISNRCLSDMKTEDIMSYCSNKGELELQIEIMKYLSKSRGVNCKPEQIILSSGIGQSLSLICQLFRSNFNQVAIEDPGYNGARNTFINNGYNVIPIDLEEDGINIGQLENSGAKMVYVTSSHQFSMGSVMPIWKRLRLLEWAEKNSGIIIEDDYDSELRYNSRPIPSIQSISSVETVVYIGTFSKSLAPSIRTSYIVLPKKWVKKYDERFSKYHSSVSLIQQKVIQQFMELGYWERHLRKICISNKRKHDTLIEIINELLGDKVIIYGKNAGLHILLEFKDGLCESELIDRADEWGVKVYPVSAFWIRLDQYTNNMVLLGFGSLTEHEIIEGVKLLSKAWL